MYGFVDRNLEVDCNEETELIFELKTTENLKTIIDDLVQNAKCKICGRKQIRQIP